MVAHRNVHHFQPRIQQTIHINRTVNVQQPRVCSTGCGGGMGTMGSIFMAMSAMNMVGDMLGGILGPKQQTTPLTNNTPQQDNTLNNLKSFYNNYTWIYQDGEYWGKDKDGNIVHGRTFEEIKAEIDKNSKPVEDPTEPTGTTQEPDGQGGDSEVVEPEEPATPSVAYDIGKKDGNKTYEIQAGDTWYAIAQAKYDIPAGVTIKDVYTALAKENYSGDDFATAMKNGIVFMPGDQIQLPDTINIKGQEVKLKGDWQNNDTIKQDNYKSKSTFRSARIQQVRDKWYVTQNGVQVSETFDSEEEAKAEKERLEAGK